MVSRRQPGSSAPHQVRLSSRSGRQPLMRIVNEMTVGSYHELIIPTVRPKVN